MDLFYHIIINNVKHDINFLQESYRQKPSQLFSISTDYLYYFVTSVHENDTVIFRIYYVVSDRFEQMCFVLFTELTHSN